MNRQKEIEREARRAIEREARRYPGLRSRREARERMRTLLVLLLGNLERR